MARERIVMSLLRTACDALAGALAYPGAAFREVVSDGAAAVEVVSAQAGGHARRFADAVLSRSLEAAQELYTQTFDFNPRCTMDTGWHVFGDAYDRGAFLAAMRDDLRAAGVEETSELPDHLPQVLRLIGRLPPARAGEFGAFATLAVDQMIEALQGQDNPYEQLLRAVADTIRSMQPVDLQRGAGE
jgi:nitrate reductase delta subunit